MPDVEIKRQLCRHIFPEGRRCGSPALRRQDFCYHHHTTRKPAPVPDAYPYFELPAAEDRTAIQLSISEVLRRIAASQIDNRRAGLLLYGLQIASLNLPRQQPANLPHPGELVEDIITDPVLGTLAPISEIVDPPEEKSFADLLIENFYQQRAENAAPKAADLSLHGNHPASAAALCTTFASTCTVPQSTEDS